MEILADHRALIAKLGGPPNIAAKLGIESINVRQWRSRNRVPPEHWSALIDMADRPDVDARWFLDTMPERKVPVPTTPTEAQAAAA